MASSTMSTTLIDEVRSGTAPPLLAVTVQQFQQMIQSGIFQDGDPIELIDGLLVRKDRSGHGEDPMTHHPRHALLIKRLLRLLTPACESAGCHVQIQLPVTLDNFNSPEPDVAVVRGSEEDYSDRHPGPADLLLVIEVADSSLNIDRSTKKRVYATAGIPTYWLINLPQSRVEVFAQPTTATSEYAQETSYGVGQSVSFILSPTQHVDICVTNLFK